MLTAARAIAAATAPRVDEAEDYHPAMSKLLLNLRNVPDDESDDVRALLLAHRIESYETQPSRWGISYGGIWVSDDTGLPAGYLTYQQFAAVLGKTLAAGAELPHDETAHAIHH